MSYPRPGNQFWNVPELVAEVCEYLANDDLCACARVSRTVSRHALRKLYKDGVRLHDIFEILGPLTLNGSRGEVFFAEKPSYREWQRFCHYARYVESLSFSHVKSLRSISDEAFLDILFVAPPGSVIFPRLRSLKWSDTRSQYMRRFNLFVTASLRDLTLSSPMQLLHGIFGMLSRSSPNLRCLSVDIPHNITNVPATILHELTAALMTFRDLQRVEIPSAFLTVDVFRLLSEKDIKTLSVRSCPHAYMELCPFEDTALRFANTPFSSLTHLSCEIDLLLLGEGKRLAARSLRALNLHVPASIAEDRLTSCAKLLADRCDELDSLSLLITRPVLAGDVSSPITARVLTSFLIAIPGLLILDIDDSVPVSISGPELELLAPLCHNLVELNTCTHALGRRLNNPPGLGSLIPFAKHCRDLKVLGIYMDATHVPNHSPEIHASFTQLRQLNVYHGMEIIDESAVAEYLGNFLSPDTQVCLKSSTRQETTISLAALSAQVFDWAWKWEQVDAWLVDRKPFRELIVPAFTQMRTIDKIFDDIERASRTRNQPVPF
ncbi:hypothetical protein SISNIDRAFT_454169 [Sistotremastrum niveocremeum HHB9708]|uniref:F-box domain-containing protein n=1 Tax=Sistotremastrum niveocremeum HHB9708 TaxID=1314777 RepID=A0A164V2A4_9AGAM|nr:hypothetical protein SISNIDRAFT_454169 [Sistotremastrum niveocremeum HHB9708]